VGVMPVSPSPRDGAGAAGDVGGRARTGRRLVVAVAAVEAVALAGAAVATVLTGLQDGSVLLGVGVGAAAAGTSYLMVEVTRGFAAGRRWPTGIFVTVQLLVALVALSVGAPALLVLASAPRIAIPTLLALGAAAVGLAGVAMLVPRSQGDVGA